MTSEQPNPAESARPSRFSTITQIALIRLGTLVLCYLMVVTTAFVLIPLIGAYVQRKSGVTLSVAVDGQIALWLLPFVFLVVMLTVGEIALMKWLWAAGGDRIRRLKTTSGEPRSTTPDPVSTPALRAEKRTPKKQRSAA